MAFSQPTFYTDLDRDEFYAFPRDLGHIYQGCCSLYQICYSIIVKENTEEGIHDKE